MKHRLLLLPLVAFAIAALVACGGDKKDKNASSQQGSGGSSSSQAAGNSGGTSNQSLDLSKSADKISELKSFRFDVTLKMDMGSLGSGSGSAAGDLFSAAFLGMLSDLKAEGAYVAPDKSDLRLRAGPLEMGFVQIGEKSWVKFGNTWQAGDSGGLKGGLGGMSGGPADILKDLGPNQKLSGAKTSKETVNGVKTTHYSFDKQALEKLAKELGETTGGLNDVQTASLDLWLSEDDVPVKISIVFTGRDEKGQKVSMDLQMNIKDINQKIEIKAPI